MTNPSGRPRGSRLDAIAKACGVSRSTVSKALNPDRTRSDISEELRNRVRSAATAMGYRPEDDPRWVGHRVTRLLGWVYGRLTPYTRGPYGRLQELLAERLVKRGWSLQFVPLPGGSDGPATLRRHGIEGAFVVQPETEAVIAALAAGGLPSVALNIRSRLDIDAVLTDDRQNACALCVRLVELGHRRIGFVTLAHHDPSVPGHHSVAARRSGLRLAIEAQPDGILGEYEIQDFLAGVDELTRWLHTWRPTAVVAYDARLAARIYQAAAALQLAIPQQLSVCCADGADLAELLAPPLSGIELPLPEMAEAAIELLLRRIGNDTGAHEERLIPGRLIERNSLTVAGVDGHHAQRPAPRP